MTIDEITKTLKELVKTYAKHHKQFMRMLKTGAARQKINALHTQVIKERKQIKKLIAEQERMRRTLV